MVDSRVLFNRIGGIAAVLAAVTVSLLVTSERPRPLERHPKKDPSAQPNVQSRTVYRYSVIPGGVASATELRDALLRDPVAAEHYRGFDVHAAQVIAVSRARKVYVSYRIADRVFWTRTKVSIPKGETLLTDGTHTARTRCGNRISETPQGETAKDEPAEAILDSAASPLWTQTPERTPVPNPKIALQIAKAATPTGDYLAQFGPATLNQLQSAPLGGAYAGGGLAGGAGGSSSGQTPSPASHQGVAVGGNSSTAVSLAGGTNSFLPVNTNVSEAFTIASGQPFAVTSPAPTLALALPGPALSSSEMLNSALTLSTVSTVLAHGGQPAGSAHLSGQSPSSGSMPSPVPASSGTDVMPIGSAHSVLSPAMNGQQKTAIEAVQVPEPASMLLLLGSGIALLALLRLRRRLLR